MLKEGKIGIFEAISLVTLVIASKVLFSSARDISEAVGTAGWYTTLISSGTALIFFYIIFLLLQRFPGQELVAVLQKVFGRLAGGLASLIIGTGFFVNAILLIREFVEAAKVYEYPLSPPSFLMVFFLLAVIALLYFGLETVARTTGFFTWFLLTGLIAIFVLAIPFYRLSNLFPFFGHGLGKTITTGLARSSGYGEVLALAVFGNSLQGLSHLKKSGVTALIIAGLLVASSLFFYSLFHPYTITVENTVPLFTMTRTIEYGRFFQRFESIFVFTWSISAILATGINLYTALSIYCKIFHIDDHRVLVSPLAIIIFTTSIFPSDISSITFTYVPLFRKFGWIVFFGIPLLALLVAIIRGKNRRPGNA